MFICSECGEIFKEPDSYQENVGEFWGMPAYQKIYVCPACGCDDFDDYYEESEDFVENEED